MSNVTIQEFPARKLAGIPHTGPYPGIGGKFFTVQQAIGGKPGVREAVGIYYDDPSVVAPEDLRSFAGMFVDDDFSTDDDRIEIRTVDGGRYAVWTHYGSYSGLPNAWAEFMASWLSASGHATRDVAPFEVYMNDCEQVPEPEVRTDLYIAIA